MKAYLLPRECSARTELLCAKGSLFAGHLWISSSFFFSRCLTSLIIQPQLPMLFLCRSGVSC